MPNWGNIAKRVGAGIASGGYSEFMRPDPFGVDNPLGNRGMNEFRDVDPEGRLGAQAGQAGNFADLSQGQFIDAGGQLRAQLGRQMRGEESLSREQLRQALGQNVAAQQSMAAGARGGNQAMAARTASMNAANIGAGMAGQQAMAGIAERQAAASQLGALRGQDLQAALGARGQAIGGYGTIEQQRGQRFGALTQVPTQQEQFLGAGSAAAQMIAMSDSRLKRDVSDGRDESRELLRSLGAKSYRYRDPEANGPGRHVGIMAQDLERTPQGRAMVMDTPEGKAIDGGKLVTALGAAASDLDRRLARVEAGDRRREQDLLRRLGAGIRDGRR